MSQVFEVQDCVDCGVRFGVPSGFTDNRRKDKRSFYCPNGHSMSYTESELDRMRRSRDQLQQRIAEKDDALRIAKEARETAERSAAAYKGQVARLRTRAANGVCPCCNRSFTNLQRHMATKHPHHQEEAAT